MTKPFGIRQKAISYRKSGYSYSMISKKLGLSKSTLSGWLKEIPFKPNTIVLERMKRVLLYSAERQRNRRLIDIAKMRKLADKEVGIIDKRDLLMLGIGIYLGEGSKLNEDIRIINSDPNIIKLAIKWFMDICSLEKKNFKPTVHLYPDTNILKAIKFWSKITGLSKSQFGKTQIDIRTNKSKKRKGKLPFGTMHLCVRSLGKKEFGRTLHRRIMGWTESVFRQI